MLAYIIVGVDVHDAPAYAAFANEVPATLEPFGGRFLVQGGAFDVIEGEWLASRIVILEFPSGIQARAWLDSAAYQAILPIRHRYGETHFTVIVDGVPQVAAPWVDRESTPQDPDAQAHSVDVLRPCDVRMKRDDVAH